jgi:REP element-mobilizing transposase RayT
MVLAYHVIFTAYGFWLPNDPRGSWSRFVAAWELLLAGGKATKTSNRRSHAAEPHDHEQRMQVKEALKYPPVEFTGKQALAIGHGFAQAIKEAGYVVYGCSILPTHVHLVIGRLSRNINVVVGHLKAKGTHRLREEGVHPFEKHVRDDGAVPSCWAEGCWKVFLDTPEDMRRAIDYVQENPVKEGKPKQNWSFVTAYG